MKNKTSNFIIALIGATLFSFSRWFVDESIFTDAESYLLVSGIVLIMSAILVLFAVINFTSIIFNDAFDVNAKENK